MRLNFGMTEKEIHLLWVWIERAITNMMYNDNGFHLSSSLKQVMYINPGRIGERIVIQCDSFKIKYYINQVMYGDKTEWMPTDYRGNVKDNSFFTEKHKIARSLLDRNYMMIKTNLTHLAKYAKRTDQLNQFSYVVNRDDATYFS